MYFFWFEALLSVLWDMKHQKQQECLQRLNCNTDRTRGIKQWRAKRKFDFLVLLKGPNRRKDPFKGWVTLGKF